MLTMLMILVAHPFNKRIDILSGPEAFFGSRWNKTLYTSLGTKIMSEIVSADLGEVGIGFSSALSKNTK